VVTGRPRRDAHHFLDLHGIADCFSAVVCMEDGPPKPAPDPVRAALRQLGVTRAWMFGDTVDDVRAARAAGVVPLGVLPPGDPDPSLPAALFAAGAARVLDGVAAVQGLLP
jgi:HAD superfamily phosphatase